MNERLLYVRLNSKYAKLSIVVAYAPIDNAEEETKDILQLPPGSTGWYSQTRCHNAARRLQRRVGQNNHNRSRVMGTHALGDITDNGERLISLCEENDFVIGGTLFPHKTIHKLTWTSPDGNTRSQIDHIMINGKWRHSLQDVRAMRHADVGSDHNLVEAKVLLKLRKAAIGTDTKRRFDVQKLKNPRVREEFNIALQNRFSVLQDEPDVTINQFHQALNDSAAEIIGHRKSVKAVWLTDDTWSIIEERKQAEKKLLDIKSPKLRERAATLFREKDKEVKTSARRDKRRYTERLSGEAQAAA